MNALKSFLQTDDDLRICLARDDSNLRTRIKEKRGMMRICVETPKPLSSTAQPTPSVHMANAIGQSTPRSHQLYFFDPQNARLETDVNTSDDGLER